MGDGIFVFGNLHSLLLVFGDNVVAFPVVLRVVSSCGCTQPTHTMTPVMPGDTGVVTVGYRGEGQRLGFFRKSVTVYSNDPRSYVRIFVRGELMKPMK